MKTAILYVGNDLQGSGTNVTTIATLSTQLKRLGYEVHAVSRKRNKVIRLLDMMWSVVAYRRQVDYVLIDTYSTWNFYYAVAVANLCRLFRLPYIPILHGGNLPSRLKNNRFLSYKLFNGAKTNVCPSHYLLEAFKKEGYTNLTYVPNTLAVKQYPFMLREELRPKLLWVRSFAEIYNPMMALKVLEKLRTDFPNATLCMVGPEKDGSLQKCMDYAKSKNLNVKFTGKLSKPAWRDLSVAYDIFINTTNFDNTPVSVMEAMALGLPIVTTNVGGIPFLITHNEEGVLVPENDFVEMATAVKKLISEERTGVFLTENARKKAETFDWEIVKHDWDKLLNQ